MDADEKGYGRMAKFSCGNVHFSVYDRYGVYRVNGMNEEAVEIMEQLGFGRPNTNLNADSAHQAGIIANPENH